MIVNELLNAKQVDAREFVRKGEWNIYDDFTQTRGFPVPELYSKILM